MSDPNTVLSAWQLTFMITVPTVLLFGWLIAVFIAAREPVVSGIAASVSPAEVVAIPAKPAAPGPPDVPAPLAA